MSKAITVEDASFSAQVMQAKMPVLLDFWKPSCAPCRQLEPIIDELTDEFAGRISFGKVDVEENPRITSQFSVMSMPTIILLKQGKVMDKIVGFRSKEKLVEMLETAL